MKKGVFAVFMGLALLLGGVSTAATKQVASVEGITEYRLDNGLRVLLFADASKPTITVNVTYFVGSRHEGYGETGMAHLLEHMMFKGTVKHPQVLTLMQKVNPWPVDDPRHVDSVAESIAHVRAVTAAQLAAFHHDYVGAGGGTLVVVGDFDASAVKTFATQSFGTWQAPKPWVRMPTPYRPTKIADETIKADDKAMAFVGAALSINVRDDDPEFPALLLGNYVYGGGTKSRLWSRLREKEGLSYGTFARPTASAFEPSGAFIAAAFCAPQNAKKAMAGLTEELSSVLKAPVPAAELAAAKKAYQAQFDNELSVDAMVVSLLGRSLYTNRPLSFLEARNANVQKVNAADLTMILQKHVRPDALVTIKVGDLP